MRDEVGEPKPSDDGVHEDRVVVQGPEVIDDGRQRRLDPARVQAERWSVLIVMLIMLMPVCGGWLWIWTQSAWSSSLCWGVSAGVGALWVGFGALLYVWPSFEQRRTAWSLDCDCLEIRRGVVWRHVISVPRRRIQHTDVAQGPLQRRFDLGTLVLHTAGTHSYEVRLEGISHATALEVRDALMVRGLEVADQTPALEHFGPGTEGEHADA